MPGLATNLIKVAAANVCLTLNNFTLAVVVVGLTLNNFTYTVDVHHPYLWSSAFADTATAFAPHAVRRPMQAIRIFAFAAGHDLKFKRDCVIYNS